MADLAPSAVPPGHSAVAHRVHGWCALCDARGYAKETMAWRVRENRREDAARALADAPPNTGVEIQLIVNTPSGPVDLGTHRFARVPDEGARRG
ncbi:hypothetical protein ACFY8S_01510 [Streptomyces hygroscopicus]|uniref:hypothetical protein n=1 Tax=Streptomyces hygroscopicus TaxID=1912 RepID=UPI00368629CD